MVTLKALSTVSRLELEAEKDQPAITALPVNRDWVLREGWIASLVIEGPRFSADRQISIEDAIALRDFLNELIEVAEPSAVQAAE